MKIVDRLLVTFGAFVVALGVSLADADVRFFAATQLSSLVYYNNTTTQINANTVDGADSAGIYVTGGGDNNSTRGGYFFAGGNENSTPGAAIVHAGNVASGLVQLRTSGTQPIDLMTNSVTQWRVDSSGNLVGVNTAGGQIFENTSDATDNAALKISGGGAVESITRGAYLTLHGNESAGGTGGVDLSAGNVSGAHIVLRAANASGTVIFRPANTTLWTMGTTGDLVGAGTGTIGWALVSGANTACTTTCTTPCVIGQNTATFALVACTDATADVCLCAGAS